MLEWLVFDKDFSRKCGRDPTEGAEQYRRKVEAKGDPFVSINMDDSVMSNAISKKIGQPLSPHLL